MKGSAPNTIAEICAAIRACHFMHGHQPLIFEDAIAIELINSDLHKICLEGNGLAYSGGASIVIGRARYTEDILESAVKSGIKQYVILGAGLDTFALRCLDLLDEVNVYEVDHPKTQHWKQNLLSEIGREKPSNLEFIPVDLAHQSVIDALDQSSFIPAEPVFFSCLGTLPYLTHEAIVNTLGSLAGATSVGSEIVFDYRVSMDFVDPEDTEIVKTGDRATAQAGEPKRSFLNQRTFMKEIDAMGYEVIESFTPHQMAERYFAGRRDVVRPTSHQYYAHLKNIRGLR